MQFLHQMIDVVFQKLDLFVLLDQQLSEVVRVGWQWTAAAGRPTTDILHRTLLLVAGKSTKTDG